MVRESGGEGLVGYRGMAVSRIRNARWKHMTKPADLHAKCIAEPAYAAAYAEAEYAGIGAMFQAQAEAGLTQEALAKRMGMMQPAIARLEGGRGLPLVETLRRHAKAVGKRLRVEMVQGGDGAGRRWCRGRSGHTETKGGAQSLRATIPITAATNRRAR